jgi:hypothetical protein
MSPRLSLPPFGFGGGGFFSIGGEIGLTRTLSWRRSTPGYWWR